MASYAFTAPVLPGKLEQWKKYIVELKGARAKDLKASRKRAGVKTERVWLQKTPMGDFAVVYLEAKDIGKVFQTFMTSTDPFDVWFRKEVLQAVHGMDPSKPPPPMNEQVL